MIAEVDTSVMHYAEVVEARVGPYRLRGDLKVKSRREAVAFVNEVGVALLFAGDRLQLPDLWSAINGGERDLPKHHHDWALHRTWQWKDEIPDRKEAWYGKIVRGKPAFIALGDLPAVYALSSNYGELDDYLEAYADGLMSVEAKSIYETLLAEGPLPTSTLRKATGLAGGGENARRFERAITELQADLKIVKAGISDANRWKYCYVYDLLLRWAPDLAEQARQYTGRAAMRHLMTRYLRASVAAPAGAFPRLFGWDPAVTERTVSEMLDDGSLRAVRVTGAPGLTAKAKPSPGGEIWLTLK